ncbi:MAG: hypothetical protein ABI354_02600 [Candidatus Saccharimonadales bacterium]
MNYGIIATVVASAIILLAIAAIIVRKRPKRLKTERYTASWRDLQKFCKDKATWPLAVLEADKLLDKALKMRKLKGKTMGERLVAAQRIFKNNDDIWFSHNLAKKLKNTPDMKLKEIDVKEALVGVRNGLKDIGALPSGENTNS